MAKVYKKVIVVFLLCITLTACSSSPNDLEGFWMADNGDTIAFDTNGKAIIDGISLDYSIFDKTYISFSLQNSASHYKFELNDGILILTDPSNGSTQKFYNDESQQKEIRERLAQIEAERAEMERKEEEAQQQAIAQEQAQREYENYVYSLYNEVSCIDNDIADRYQWIENNEYFIETAEPSDDDIPMYHDEIAQWQREIEQLEAQKRGLIATLTNLGEY